jgi:hypothetical protein
MTLLTLAQDILEETKNASVPLAIIGNTDSTAKQALQALTVSITELSRSNDWQELMKEGTVTTVASTEGYALASDFDRFINNTFWNSTQSRKVIGAQSPQEWMVLKNGTLNGTAAFDYYRIRDNEILLYPIPLAVESFVYEYISNLIVNDSGGTGQTGWEADTDVPVIDAHLVRLDATWRLLKIQGRTYEEELRIANEALGERIAINGSKKTIRHFTSLDDDNVIRAYPEVVPTPS